MRRAAVGAVALCAGLCLALPSMVDAQSRTLAFAGPTLIDVTDGALRPDQTVLIEGERIVRIGPSDEVPVPDGAEVVEASGHYLIPGLWDAHVHSAGSVSWHFPLLLSHGITSVRNMHSTVENPLALTTSIAKQVSSGELLGPRFLANGPLVDGDPPTWPETVVVRNETEARAAVDALVDGGADFIKVYDSLSREAFLAVADQARIRGIPMDGHMPFLVPPEEAAAAGMRTVEHTSGITLGCSTQASALREEYSRFLEVVPTLEFPDNMRGFFRLLRAASDSRDVERCQTTIRAYLAAGVAVVPTLVGSVDGQKVVADPDLMRMIPAGIREEWKAMAARGDPLAGIAEPIYAASVANLKLMHAAHVPVLAGTDISSPFLVPGVSLHDELARLVEDAGLSPLEALRAATLEPARVFGLTESLGDVSVGKLADLVLLDANPLDDIRNTKSITGVVVNGRYLDRGDLDELQANAAAAIE